MFDLLAGLAFVLLAYSVFKRLQRLALLPLPPGPKGYPVIGNLFDWPAKGWVNAQKWSKEFSEHRKSSNERIITYFFFPQGSDVIYLNILGQGVVLLNSSEAIADLLDRRSTIYSDRPRMPMVRELMNFHFAVPFLPYGKSEHLGFL